MTETISITVKVNGSEQAAAVEPHRSFAQRTVIAQSYGVKLVTLWLMIFFCLAAPSSAASLQKIVVAYVSPSDSMIIPGIARDSGILAKYGFDADVVLVTGSPRVVQSLIGGSFDYAIPGGTPLLRARVQGADTVILSTITDYSTQQIMVHPRSGIQSVEQLKGKKVGVTQYGSEGDAFLRLVLQRAGLKPDIDVQIIQTGGSGLTVTSLVAGKIDAGAMGGSVTSVLASRKTGAKTLITAQELNVLAPSGVLATTRRKIARSRDEVRRFIQAYVEAIHFLKNNREAAIRIMQKYMGGLPMDIVSQLYDDARDEFPPLPLAREEAIQAVLDRDADPKTRSLKAKDFIDMSFLRELEERGFVTALYQKR